MSKQQTHSSSMSSVLTPVDPAIERYQLGLLPSHKDNALMAMETRAMEYNFPIVGRLVGVFLEMLAKTANARRIFEFGSGFGYSAYWFARAVGDKGEVICTDGDALNQKLAENYLKTADLWQRVRFRTGWAQDIFQQTDGQFDICYNDVDKDAYPEIWLMAKERIRPGGLYIADNVLWHGRVALDSYEDLFPGWTEAILEHNRLIFNDPNFDAFINPTRDGVIVARKKID
jgi:caffeoyl-CoA O-methyltransferase